MRQLDLIQATLPTAATVSNMTASRPAAALSAGLSVAGFGSGSGFSANSTADTAFSSTFRQVQNDVTSFIAGGASTTSDAFANGTPTLSAQALSLRQGVLGQSSGVIDGGLAASGIDGTTQQQFLASIKPWAEETAGKLGVSPDVVAAHAALESGWGQRPLRNGGAGADSNNLFGLKAGGSWAGAVASATTTEYEHGAALKKVERFRSYPDTASAFRDYADMLTGNPRYAAALNTGTDARAFAQGLKLGGYATDPAYADKLGKLAATLQKIGGLGSAAAARLQHQSGD